MKRSIKNAIEEYRRRFWYDEQNAKTQRGEFYVSDTIQLLEMSEDKYDLVSNSMQAGFMIGYRLGRKDQKEGRR